LLLYSSNLLLGFPTGRSFTTHSHINLASEVFCRRCRGLKKKIPHHHHRTINDVADLKIVKILTSQCHGATSPDASVTTPMQRRSAAHVVPRSTRTRMVYRCRLGSSPAEKRKKYLDWKSGSATTSGVWSFL
jgi:hypothetical protein